MVPTAFTPSQSPRCLKAQAVGEVQRSFRKTRCHDVHQTRQGSGDTAAVSVPPRMYLCASQDAGMGPQRLAGQSRVEDVARERRVQLP